MTAKVLIVEDDPDLNRQLSGVVRDAGYLVDSCLDGDSGLLAATKQQHHLMLLDIMLPKRDGISLLSTLRKSSELPVILVSAKGAEEERIRGLKNGADDFITKPFNTTELILRIQAILRRSQTVSTTNQKVYEVDGLQLNQRTRQVMINNHSVLFTLIQFKLLFELMKNQGEVMSKAYLSQQVLNRTLGKYDRGLDMHLSRIRRKLNEAGWQGERLQTVHGEGYCLK